MIKYINIEENDKFFSYTQKFDLIDSQILISNKFYENKHQFFWENNKSDQTFIGFGSIDKIEIYNASELKKIKSIISQKLNTIIDISENEYISPKFFGGFAFDINSKSFNNWNNFPRGYFILPECIITSDKNCTFISIIKKITHQLTPEMIYNEIKMIYTVIF